MRRTMLVSASAVLLACLGACTDDRSDAASDDAAVVEPAATPEPTPLDPFAWADVDYEDYLAAADELGLRPEVLLPMAGFSSSLNLLCHTSADDLAKMRTEQMDHTKETETYSNAKYLGDEVALRLGLACPQRMADWNAAGIDPGDDGENDADDGVSAVTDADLAEAVAEEAEASSAPDYSDADDNGADAGTEADDDEVSTTSVSSRP